MFNLFAAAAYFVLLHLLVSGTPLRDALTGKIGEGPYMGLFSAASIVGLVWLGFAFAHARGGPGDLVWWTVTPATRIAQIVLQLLAFLLIVPGISTRNPTAVRQGQKVEDPNIVKGMVRITRHPFLWGVTIWAGGHILVNGDAAGLVLFGSLLALALFGTVSIDAKRRRKLGEKWDAFAAQTSNLPFGAIFAGRQKLNVGEIGWVRLVAAVVVWAALAYFHPYLFGVRALP